MILDRENKYNFILCCKPFASFVRCAIYNIVIETFDTLSCPDKNFNIYLHFLLFASHPLNGWIWFGEGLRGYDNWQRSAASDYKQNGHENMAIPLKSVAATTPKSRAEEKLLRLI